ncbi:staygreen family protein [Clostridium sp. D43t1_170807_H7]|uniref:staygreen family protein n=1 Tax=Clostridium sp. D43t1_170807_H7 TaxID=2787140 RepID=UPI0018979722
MIRFQPEKLNVSYKDEVGIKTFLPPRKYTLTHSDESGELFLSIGKKYDLDQINYNIRDEVLGSWEKDDKDYLLITLEVDNGEGISNTIKRDKIFRQKLTLALIAIVYGDNLFFENNKELYEAPVRVRFNSKVSEYDTLEEWGKVEDYKYNLERYNNELPNYKFNPFPILPPVQTPGYIKAVNEKKKKRDNAIEMALITTLEPYISREVYTLFGKDTPYCIKKSEIIDAKVVNTYGPCSEEYEIVIGLKVGKRPPFYNNMIITFLIDENGVKIKNVKNPKYK